MDLVHRAWWLCVVALLGQQAMSTEAAGESVVDVVIVGAGMAGMAAAAALQASGVKVVVLEARNRLGGRTWSENVTVGGATFPVDLGASWIHGITSNPLVPLAAAAKVGLAAKNTNYENSAAYYDNGKAVPDSSANKYDDVWGQFEDFYAGVQDNFGGDDPGIMPTVNAFIAKKKLTGQDLLAFKYALDVNLQHEYGSPLAELALWFDEDSERSGGDKLVTGGYANMVQYLAKGVNVKLSTEVKEVRYSSSGVTVLTSGTTYKAKHVIVTLPLGVLKAGSVKFTPPLPAANAKAIASLGVGLLDKCILVFDAPFWGTNVEFIERISSGNGAWEEWLSLYPATKKAVLIGFNAATYAASLEMKTNAAIVAEAMAVLRATWPSAPNPVASKVSKWKLDPHALGSYSFTTPKQEFEPAHQNVGKPVGGGRVVFAGEHTSVKYPATVHGAYESGRAAACAVAKSLGKSC